MRRLLLTATFVVVIVCTGAVPASATVTGLGDQNPGFFEHPSFRELGIDRVRVVVPWDAALTNDARAEEWIQRALAEGLVPLVAFEKSRGVVCPGAGCHGPSPATYQSAVAAFLSRWPQITEVTPWNEPNHRGQPTAGQPAVAAQYYNAARSACQRCVLVAGDLLDAGNLAGWLAEYGQALVEQPAVWGLHNYYDATYFASSGIDTLARVTTGQIWLTETGGIVRFSTPEGGGLPYDEMRAADSLRWLYALTAMRSRVARMYVYHWQGRDDNDFDGGLVGPQGQARPGLAVVREHTRARPRTARQPPAGRTPIVLALAGKGLRLVKGGLRVGAACVSAPKRCRGRLVVTIPRAARTRYRPRLAMNLSLRPGQSVMRHLRTSRRVRRALLLRYRLRVTYCLDGTRCRVVHRRLVVRGRR